MKEKLPDYLWTFYLYLGLYILHAIDIYNSAVVVFVKDKRDVLQGISKLDYFLKVSIFQIYKDKLLQTKKQEKLSIFFEPNMAEFLRDRKFEGADRNYSEDSRLSLVDNQ